MWVKTAVPNVCCANSKGYLASYHGVRGYFFVMATMKFTFNSKNNVSPQIIEALLGGMFISYDP